MLRDGHDEAVSAMALQDRADIIIIGTAASQPAEAVPGDNATYSCQASVDVKAISTDTGQIIAATRGKSVGAAFTAANASETAMELAAKNWVEKNLGKLVREAVDPCHDFTLTLTGCSHEPARRPR